MSSEEKEDNLSPQQRLFVEYYVSDIGLNATLAAIKAGYSENSARQQASRLLTNDDIQAAISKLMLERSERNKIDADYVLRRAKMMHESCWSNDDAKNAIAALKLVGDHVGVQAFKQQTEISGGIAVEAKGLDAFYGDDGDVDE